MSQKKEGACPRTARPGATKLQRCGCNWIVGQRNDDPQLRSHLVESAQFRNEEKKLLSAAQTEVPAFSRQTLKAGSRWMKEGK